MLKQLFFWAAIFWTGIIAFFCLVQLNNVPFGGVSNLDKLVHAFFHFVFTLLWFLFFKTQVKSLNSSKPLAISFLLSLFFGISIEIFQRLLTTSRQADVFDVLANIAGATLAIVAVVLLKKYTKLKNFL